MALRAITAAILAIVFIFAILLLPSMLLGTLLFALSLIAAIEYARLLSRRNINTQRGVILLMMLCVCIQFMWAPIITYTLISVSIVWIWVISVMVARLHLAPFERQLVRFRMLSILMLAGCIAGIIQLFVVDRVWILVAIGLAVSFDIGGYMLGRYFGSTPFFARYSPNKTWQGFWGGTLLSAVFAGICAFFIPQHFIVWLGLWLLGLLSVFGDLYISIFKRIANLKDTGALLPGHGGILDRIDSYIVCMPVFALWMLLMQMFGLYQ